MSSGVLDAIDERIDTAEQDVTRAKAVVGSARELRTRLEEERQRARGQLTRGEPAALVDLDRVVEEIIGARRAEQDAQGALNAASAAVPPLRKERERAEADEIRVHLAPMLDVRAALAAQFEAQLRGLAATASRYKATVKETVNLGNLLGAPTGGHLHQHLDMIVARRLLLVLRPALMAEFSHLSIHQEPRMPEAEAEATKPMRERVDASGAAPA